MNNNFFYYNYDEVNSENLKNNYRITSTDLLVLNASLYLYNTYHKPVTIPMLEDLLGIRYTTLKHCVKKFEEMGLFEKVYYNGKTREVYGYIPKNNVVFVLSRNSFIVVHDYYVTVQYNKIDLSKYVGQIIPLDSLPYEIRETISKTMMDPLFILIYTRHLKKKYYELLKESYLELKQKLLEKKD